MRAGAVPEHTAPVGRGREGPSSVWVEGGGATARRSPKARGGCTEAPKSLTWGVFVAVVVVVVVVVVGIMSE